MERQDKHKRPSIKQHKDLLLNQQYRHRVEANRKVRLFSQQHKEHQQELKEFLNGTDHQEN